MENNILITGYKVKVDDLENLLSITNHLKANNALNLNTCTLQLLNAEAIAGKNHILNATKQAIIAFKRGENIAKDLGLEICLRTTAQRQISKALDIVGLKKGKMNICVVAVNCREKILIELEKIWGKNDDTVLKPDLTNLKKIYGLNDSELKIYGSIEKLMIEKTAMLTLEL
ncbi:MAG: KEOPS complex subunit Cgi121 [Methanomicrobiales archaeon]